MDSGEFDPRFDPAFQPGYDPGKHRTAPRRLFNHNRSAGGSAAVTSPDAGGPAITIPASGHVDDRRPGVPPTGSTDATQAPFEPKIVADAPPVPLGSNPYVRMLWFVTAGLVAGGYFLFWWANSEAGQSLWNGSQPTFLMILQQATWVLVPAMITVGLAGLVGLLFLYASRWRPGGATEEPSHRDPTVAADDGIRRGLPEGPGRAIGPSS